MIIDREKKLLKSNSLIRKMVFALSSEGRFILASREIENLSFKEIALITGKKADDLRRHFRQLKDELQRQLISGQSSAKQLNKSSF